MRFYALASLLLGGCSVIHSADRDPEPPVTLPERFSVEGEGELDKNWWTAFSDPELDALVQRAFDENLDLQRAAARLQQAYALRGVTASGYWPQLSYDLSSSIGRRQFGPQVLDLEQHSVSLAASYEVDLWGRIYNQHMAAKSDYVAMENDVDAIAVSLSAQIAETWFAILEQRARKALTEEQIRSNETFLELVELRFQTGLTSGLDVFQQRQQLAASRTGLPQIEARLQVLEHQLAVLLGQAPTGIPKTYAGAPMLPRAPPLPPVGVPAKIIAQRPDVRAAQMRVVASDHRIGSALADMFPAIRLSGSVGTAATTFTNLFTDFVFNFAAGITGPVFDGGRRLAELDRSKAVMQEQLVAYGQTVLTAVREVEDALVQERKQRDFVTELDQQVALARSTLDEAQNRYVNGLSDYLPVLTALRTVQTLEQSRVTAQRQLLSFRIQLCRALSGAPPRKENS